MINPFERPELKKLGYKDHLQLIEKSLIKLGDSAFFDSLGIVCGVNEKGRLFTTKIWLQNKLFVTKEDLNSIFPGKKKFAVVEILNLLQQIPFNLKTANVVATLFSELDTLCKEP